MVVDSIAQKHIFRELKKDLDERRIVILLGAGISISTSNGAPTASWRGLLLRGIEHCAGFGQPRPVTGWSERMRWLVEHGDTEDLLAVATEIERRLQGDKFRDWMNSAISALPRFNTDL